MRLALMSVMLFACGSKSEPPPGPQPAAPTAVAPPTIACEPAINEAAKRIAAESKRVDLDAKAERIKLTMIASCEAEKWPASVMGCIAAARLDVDLDACTEQLTHAQWVKLHAKIAALEPPPAPTPPPPAAAPPRPTVAAAPRPRPQDSLLEPGALRNPLRPAKPDCSRTVVDATNRACVQEFCKAHQADPRCMIE